MDIREMAEDVHDRFSEAAEVTVDEIEERLETLIDEFSVPADEAERSVISHFEKETGVEAGSGGGGGGPSEATKIADIAEPDEWMTLEVKCVELWDSDSDAVGQTGLIGDDTATIKFTAWAKSDLPSLEEGTSYRLENVVSDEFRDRLSVNLNSSTEIEELDGEVEVGDREVAVEGALVAVKTGSGLIKRCPEEGCTRVLQDGRCGEHGEVEGSFDLRVKAVVDDGETAHDVILDREATEELTGLSLEEAKERAQDALDRSVVTDELKEMLVGRYYRVTGPELGRYLLANEIEEVTGDVDADAVLMDVRAAQ